MTDRELMQQALDALAYVIQSVGGNAPESFDVWFQKTQVPAEALRARLAQPEQEPVAWMHNFIDEVVIAHRPADLDRHPDRWTALYKDPTPCQTCEALARTVMMDQVSYDIPPRHREPPTQDLSAPLTVNGVPMYPQREWQGLTDEERYLNEPRSAEEIEYAKAIEAKLKEKNNG